MSDWRIYVILDPSTLPPGRGLEETCRAAIAGGATAIQLRDKEGPTRDVLEQARRLASICREAHVTFIVNDRVDVALAAGADGVHVGPHDLPVAEVRRIAPDLIVGASAGTAEVARGLVQEGATYLGSGAVFHAGRSKPDAVHERGPEALASVVRAVDVPVVGIGGITAENLESVAAVGAAGVAVIRAVCAADDARAAAHRLRSAWDEVATRPGME